MYLGIDQISAQIKAQNKSILVGGVVDGGYFPDFSRKLNHSIWGSPIQVVGFRAVGDPPLWYPAEYDFSNKAFNYSKYVRNVFQLMRVARHIHPSCLRANAKVPSNCMFAAHALKAVQTPLLIYQVRYVAIKITCGSYLSMTCRPSMIRGKCLM